MILGDTPLSAAALAAAARGSGPVQLSDAALRRIAACHATVEALAREGAAVYGVNTGLGAAVDTARAVSSDVQRRIPLARAAGVGPRLPRESVRAAMLARLARLTRGVSGCSPAMAQTLAALLDRGVTPAVPAIGSIGEADLIPMAHIAATLAGDGQAEWEGELLPATEALARAGIVVPPWGAKDGLALVSSNAAAVGAAALLVTDAARVLDAALAAAALSLEAFRGSLTPFDPRAAALRRAPGQAEAADALLAHLAGGALLEPGAARRLQDPLSFRVFPSVHGAATDALDRARALVDLELDSSDDNPAILDTALPTGNFDTTALALAVEALGQALLRVAVAAASRAIRLMSPATCDLPRFLAAPGRNGFATVQKTLAALLAGAQHDAAPIPAVVLDVADTVEDYASMAAPIVDKTVRVLWSLRHIVAIELMVAAQGCDLRQPLRLGAGTGRLHAVVRARVATLDDDRPTGPDIESLAAAIAEGAFA